MAFLVEEEKNLHLKNSCEVKFALDASPPENAEEEKTAADKEENKPEPSTFAGRRPPTSKEALSMWDAKMRIPDRLRMGCKQYQSEVRSTLGI